jgi:large subunit ribosomal protein L17
MVTSLLKHERIRTTGAKARELRRWADHMITLAKRGDLHARRQALAIVREKAVVHKLFEQASERFGAVSGGYTRIVKLGLRPGDAAPISLVELVYSQDTKKKKTKKKKTKAGATPKKAAADNKIAADEVAAKKENEKPKRTVKTQAAMSDKEEDKPKKETGAAPEKKTSAEKKDPPDNTKKKESTEKSAKDDK